MQKLKYIEGLTYTFHYTESEYIKFVLSNCTIDCLAYDSWVTVFFKNNENTTLLAFGAFYEKLYNFVYCLEKSLDQKKMINQELITDLGILFNEMHYKKSILHETIMCDELYNHVVWSPIIDHKNIQTWLYNNTNEEIVLFLAPVYPFFNCRSSKKNPSYQEWIKTYKPIAKCILSRVIAQQWLKQAHDIMHHIEINSASMLDRRAKEKMKNT